MSFESIAIVVGCIFALLYIFRRIHREQSVTPPQTKGHALCVVDMLNGFMPNGELPVPDADKIVDFINKQLMDIGDYDFDLAFAVCDAHPANSTHFEKFPVHCVKGTPSADFVSTLYSDLLQEVFLKGEGVDEDGFSGATPQAIEYLRNEGIHTVSLVGVATRYCVKETAIGFHNAGFKVNVLLEGCRCLDAEGEAQAVKDLRGLGITVFDRPEIGTP